MHSLVATHSRTKHLPARLLVVSCLIAACGGNGSPTPPSTLPLRAGRQLLTVIGAAVSTDPRFPPCAPVGVPREGTGVNTFVTLAVEGSEWVARSTNPAEGDIELRIRAGERSSRGYTVTGTIRGTGIDVGVNSAPRDVRVTLSASGGSGTAVLEGETISPVSSFVGGRLAGDIRFSDRDGASSACSAVQWTMQPF